VTSGSMSKEFYVAESKLLGLALSTSMVSVFAHLQEKIECKEGEFTNCAQSSICGIALVLEDVIWDCNWDSHLGLCCRVDYFVCFHLAYDGGMVVGGARSIERVG